jgi:hypothetical protein
MVQRVEMVRPVEPQGQSDSPARRQVAAANEIVRVTDSTGKEIGIRRQTALEKALLLKGLGANAASGPYVQLAAVASHVVEIDGAPVPPARNDRQVDAIIARLGDEGLEAVAEAFPLIYPQVDRDQEIQLAKNS